MSLALKVRKAVMRSRRTYLNQMSRVGETLQELIDTTQRESDLLKLQSSHRSWLGPNVDTVPRLQCPNPQ